MITVVVEITHNDKMITHELEYKKEDLHIFMTFDTLLESLNIHRQIVVYEDDKDGMYIKEYFEKYMNEV